MADSAARPADSEDVVDHAGDGSDDESRPRPLAQFAERMRRDLGIASLADLQRALALVTDLRVAPGTQQQVDDAQFARVELLATITGCVWIPIAMYAFPTPQLSGESLRDCLRARDADAAMCPPAIHVASITYGIGSYACVLLITALTWWMQWTTARREACSLWVAPACAAGLALYANLIAMLKLPSVMPMPWGASQTYDTGFKYAYLSCCLPLHIAMISRHTGLPFSRAQLPMLLSWFGFFQMSVVVTALHTSAVAVIAAALLLTASIGLLTWKLHAAFVRLQREEWAAREPFVALALGKVVYYCFFAAISMAPAIVLVNHVNLLTLPATLALAVVAESLGICAMAIIVAVSHVNSSAVTAAGIALHDLDAKESHIHSHRVFLRFISHELRVPMSNITMGVELMYSHAQRIGKKLAQAEEASDAGGRGGGTAIEDVRAHLRKTRETLGTVRHSSYSITSIIEDILSLTKIESGKLDLQMEEFDVPDMVRNVAWALRAVAKTRNVQLVLKMPPTMPRLIGDHMRLSQVIANFLSNAIKHSAPNQRVLIMVGIRSADPEAVRAMMRDAVRRRAHLQQRQRQLRSVVERLRRARAGVPEGEATPGEGEHPSQDEEAALQRHKYQHYYLLNVKVKDYGSGVPPSKQKCLFQPFHRLKQSSDSEDIGMGLALSKGIVDQHGGRIGMYSEGENKGALFFFTVPLEQALSEQAAAAAAGGGSALDLTARSSGGGGGGSGSGGSGRDRLLLSDNASTTTTTTTTTTSESESPRSSVVAGSSTASGGGGGVGRERMTSDSLGPPVDDDHRAAAAAAGARTSSRSTGRTATGSRGQASPQASTPTVAADDRTPRDGGARSRDASVPRSSRGRGGGSGGGRSISPVRKRALRVLVVDDVPANAMFLAELIEDVLESVLEEAAPGSCMAQFNKVTVSTAENGAVALDELRAAEQKRRPFDIMCLDKEMPVMTGGECVQQLRAEGFTLPVLGVTGNALQADIQDFLDRGVTGVVTKPVHGHVIRDRIVSTLEQAFGKKAARR